MENQHPKYNSNSWLAFVLASNGFVRTNPKFRDFNPLHPEEKIKVRKRKLSAAGVYPVAPDFLFLEMIML